LVVVVTVLCDWSTQPNKVASAKLTPKDNKDATATRVF